MTQERSEIPSLMATLSSYEGLFGPYHPQTLILTTVLAEALCDSGDRNLGKRLLARAVTDSARYHGRYHPARLRAIERWSTILRQDGDWEAALPVQRELLECRDHLLGPDHPEAVAARRDLSSTVASLMHYSAPASA